MKTFSFKFKLIFTLFFLTLTSNLFANITTCPGLLLDASNGNLDGTTVSRSVSGSNININGYTTHYFSFTPAVDGTVEVSTSMNKTWNSLYIKSGCSTTLWSDTSNSYNKSSSAVSISAGQQVVIAYKRRYSSSAKYDITVSFTATDPKESCPGQVIPNLDATSSSATDADSGVIPGNTTYYYYFTPAVDGTIQVNSTVYSGSSNSLYIKDGCGAVLWSKTNNSNSKSSPKISVNANQKIVIALERRYYSNKNFDIDFSFEASLPIVEDASDICYDSVSTSGMCGSFFSFNCTITTPIRNIGGDTLTDVEATLGTSSLFSAFSDCGVDGSSGNCSDASGLSMMAFSAFNGGINYKLPDYGVNDAHTTYNRATFSFFNSPYDWVATYVKNGTRYVGKIVPCDDAPIIDDDSITVDNTTTAGTALYGIIPTAGVPIDYHINTGNSAGFFAIDNYGKITAAQSLNSASTTTPYILNITATDNKGRSDDANITITVINKPIVTNGFRDFELRNPATTRNIRGDAAVLGNTILCVHNSNGKCYNYTGSRTNQELDLKYIDTDSDSSTYNSSQAKLDMPSDAVVKWAALYTQGNLHRYTEANAKKKLEEAVFLTFPSMSKLSIYPNVTNIYPYGNFRYGSNYGYTYATYSQIPQLIGKKASDINGWVTAANIKATTGSFNGQGNFGAWTLVVVYKSKSDTFKNVSVFDGYKMVYSGNGYKEVSIPISGFVTPQKGAVVSRLSIFTAEGDKNIEGDKLYIDGVGINTKNAFYSGLNNVTANPSYTNNQGIDIQNHDIGIDGDNSHKQIIGINRTSTTMKFTSSGDLYFPSVAVFSTELRQAKLCYDYTYGQNNNFITAANITTPTIDGVFLQSSPIDVKLYFTNLEDSDAVVENLTLNIDPIDISKAKYRAGSTYVARVNQSRTAVSDGSLSIGTNGEYLNNIYLGDLGRLEYFYAYYSLDPQKSTINDMLINASVDYDLIITLNGVTTKLDHISTSITEMNPCQTTASYEPIPGLFNIVHDGQTKLANPYFYYNIPTQVVKRAGNFHVQSMDPDDLNKSEAGRLTAVAVEMMDIAGFHYASATCTDSNATVLSKKRVWAIFDNNTSSITPLDKTKITDAEFFHNAVKNAAFRLSYNAADGNGSIIKLTKLTSGKYKLTNFPSYGGQSCSAEFTATHSGATVNQWCGSNGDGSDGTGMTSNALASCMECIYGFDTKMMCSRDNFSIRPEAFLIKINDLNQTNSNRFRLADQVSGVSSPVYEELDLAADYNYSIEINATNHLNNEASAKYTKSFTTTANTTDAITYKWDPRGTTVTGCNDTADKQYAFNFVNGEVDANISLAQVGKYKLQILDTTWTAVDHDAAYTTHHIPPYFTTSSDCLVNDSSTQPTTSSSLNGCNITSQHTNTDAKDNAGSTITLKYNDYDVAIHPYKFDLNSITPSHGFNNTALGANSFIYMADMSQDQNMSFHLGGNIIARGYNNAQLSNFVTKCYAQPLNLDLNGTDNTPANVLTYQYRLNNEAVHDINLSDAVVLQDGNFTTANSGSATTTLNFNFSREANTSVNPKSLTFSNYTVECSTSSNCSFYANTDGTAANTKTTQGQVTINNTLLHYYGRSHVTRQRFVTPAGTSTSPGKAFIYYEVYCSGATCDKTLLQDGVNSQISDDPRWFINTQHTSAFGSANATTQKGASVVTGTTATGNHPDFTNLVYGGGKGYPYKTTMQNSPSNWLIYNKYDANANTNEFQAEFLNGNPNWSGAHETDTTSVDGGTSITNRRLMW